jgi:hypothetical protein
MNAAQLPPVVDADFSEVRDERRADRRKNDRRATRARFDTLFAATLVNHVTRPDEAARGAYPRRNRVRPGIALDLRA